MNGPLLPTRPVEFSNAVNSSPQSSGSRNPRPPKAVKPPPPNYPSYSWRETRISVPGSTSGRPREFHYVTSIQQAELLIPRLQSPIGFDAEWKPTYVRGEGENPVALVQLADDKMALLIHIAQMNWTVPRALKTLLEDPTLLKVGVGINGDKHKIYGDLGVVVKSCVELSSMAKAIDYNTWMARGKNMISLSTLIETYVLRILQKPGQVRRGNWELWLRSNFQEYAANDAAAGLSVYSILKAKMDAIPPEAPIPDPNTFIDAPEPIIRSIPGYDREFEPLPLPPPPDPAVLAAKEAKKEEKEKKRLERLARKGIDPSMILNHAAYHSRPSKQDRDEEETESSTAGVDDALPTTSTLAFHPSNSTSIPNASTLFRKNNNPIPGSSSQQSQSFQFQKTLEEIPQLASLRLRSRTASLDGTPQPNSSPLPTFPEGTHPGGLSTTMMTPTMMIRNDDDPFPPLPSSLAKTTVVADAILHIDRFEAVANGRGAQQNVRRAGWRGKGKGRGEGRGGERGTSGGVILSNENPTNRGQQSSRPKSQQNWRPRPPKQPQSSANGGDASVGTGTGTGTGVSNGGGPSARQQQRQNWNRKRSRTNGSNGSQGGNAQISKPPPASVFTGPSS